MSNSISASDLGSHDNRLVIVEMKFLNQTIKTAMLRKDFNRIYNTGFGKMNPETAVGYVVLSEQTCDVENQEVRKLIGA